MKIRIKYFEGATKLKRIAKGNWIDVYSREDVFIPEGERGMIPLGFALELPKGFEGHLAPRSSTFKTWGIIQTNSVGVVDDTYIGDNDEWCFPAYCLVSKGVELTADDILKRDDVRFVYSKKDCEPNKPTYLVELVNGKFIDIVTRKGTWIKKGDKIGQFRIMEVQPEFDLIEVDHLGNEDRGSFGSTGTR